jgi:hypothetical protein
VSFTIQPYGRPVIVPGGPRARPGPRPPGLRPTGGAPIAPVPALGGFRMVGGPTPLRPPAGRGGRAVQQLAALMAARS